MRLLYRIYQLFIGLPLGILATALTAIITTMGCTLGKASFWALYPAMLWSRFMCWIFLLPVRVKGHQHLQENESYVFVANHQGAYDIFLIYGYLGRHFKWMMKKSLRRIPLVGRACEDAGHIFVDKSGPHAMQQTVDQARRILCDGVSLVVFPEGSRSDTGVVGTFHRGAFQLADELQLAVVPVSIEGSFEVLSRKKGFNFLTWHPLSVTFHEPIAPQGKGMENERWLMQESRRVILKQLHQS